MSDEPSPAAIKRTQDTLGKFVKKPGLTEKLLKKPPFRFLFDVFSVVIRDTKCFVGLYTVEELAYENIKDRDDKMKFLQKMIDVVKLTTGSSLAIKTSKIVAGHEPEKTNELLQLMAEIIEKKLDWQKAVEQVVAGKVTHKKSPRKPNEATNKTSKDNVSKAKSKEKPKEKDSNTKGIKTVKAAGSKTVMANKDEKSKKTKVKENNTKQLALKEDSTTKRNKELESLKKPVNDATNKITKLKKADSQLSNVDSSSVHQQEAKQPLISTQNEADCNHEEKLDGKREYSKVADSPTQLTQSQLLSSNEVYNDNPNDSLQSKSSSAEKTKRSSPKSRKSSAEKLINKSRDKEKDKEKQKVVEMSNPPALMEEKLGIMENEEETLNASKQDSTSSADLEQDTTKTSAVPKTLNTGQSEIPPTTQTSIHKPLQSTAPLPPANSTKNEMKRESTFTRESSIVSNKSYTANRPRTTLRPPSARPPSARPGAPRRRDKNIEIVLQPNDQIKMSGIQVKLETFGDLDDDGENLVIIENPNTSDITMDQQQINLTESEKAAQDATLEQGHLVQQILETQKELVQQPTDASGSQQKNDKDSTKSSLMRQTSARHMDNLREVIQNITKSVNPLGKLMDFIPEDIDAMQLEYTLWRDAYTQAASELKRERSLTESAVEPMQNQLVQIEANIAEYVEMIDASRLKILQNHEKILKMLTT